jgi:hypothetical protein
MGVAPGVYNAKLFTISLRHVDILELAPIEHRDASSSAVRRGF